MKILAAAALSVATVLLALPSQAAYTDHLKCYKIKDEHRYEAAASLYTNEKLMQLLPSESDCRILVNSKEFCVPVEKQRVPSGRPKEAPSFSIAGHELRNNFLCYKVKCSYMSGVLPGSMTVVDQFGSRDISGFKTQTLCTPASVYDDPAPVFALTRLRIEVASLAPPRFGRLKLRVVTSVDAEFMINSLVLPTSPAGVTPQSVVEDIAARDCPGGTPLLGPSGGCTQSWDVEYTIDDSLCVVDGNYSWTFDVGCNTNMPDCDLVDPAEPDVTTTAVLVSSDFCAGPGLETEMKDQIIREAGPNGQ